MPIEIRTRLSVMPSRALRSSGTDKWVMAAGALIITGSLQEHSEAFRFRNVPAYMPVLLPLAHSPRWASSRPDEPSPYGPGRVAPPARIQALLDKEGEA